MKINTDEPLEKLKKKYIISIIFTIILFFVAISSFVYGYILIQKPSLVVLLFHDVVEQPRFQWEITPEKLDYYIQKLLSLKYKPVDPEDFESILDSDFKGRNFLLTFDDGTGKELESIKKIYKKYNIKSVLFLIEDFIDRTENMSKNDILDLKNNYGTFLGIHGKHHIRYTEQIKKCPELGLLTKDSIKRLNSLFNVDIKWLSYPFGDYTLRIINEVKKTPIKLAFTIDSGNIDKNTNKMEINRYMYMGGLNPDGEDIKLNLSLLPPEDYSNGQMIIILSVMVFLFFISRIYICWRYSTAIKKYKNE